MNTTLRTICHTLLALSCLLVVSAGPATGGGVPVAGISARPGVAAPLRREQSPPAPAVQRDAAAAHHQTSPAPGRLAVFAAPASWAVYVGAALLLVAAAAGLVLLRTPLGRRLRSRAGGAGFSPTPGGRGAPDLSLLDHADQGVLVHRDGVPLYANTAAARMFGYTDAAAIMAMASIYELAAPEERERLRRQYTARVRGEAAPTSFEVHATRPDGEPCVIQEFVRLVDWQGEPAAMVTLLDITERHALEGRLRAQEGLLRTVIDALPHWITAKDAEGRHVLVNEAMREAHGLPMEAIIGRRAEELAPIAPERVRRTDEVEHRVLRTGERVEVPAYWMQTPEGEWQLRHMVKTPLQDGDNNATGVVGWSEDITARYEREQELQAAKESAEAANRLKDKFVSLVAHDLRSPIASIKLMVDALAMEDETGFSDQQQRLQEAIVAKCDGMVAMIDELLKISRLQSGTLVPEPRFVNAGLVTSVAFEMRREAESKGVTLRNEVDDDLRLYVDLNLFREVVQNLVANAIKFCGPGDTVTLYTPRHSRSTLAVHDTGAGVQPTLLADIFRHDVKTTTAGTAGELGTGLGLPLCHDIVAAHGGSMWVESRQGEGSTFYAAVPYVQPSVLLDDAEVRTAVHDALKALDIAVLSTSLEHPAHPEASGAPHLVLARRAAVERLQRHLAEWGRDIFGREVPVILLAEPGTLEETRALAQRAGAADVIEKPLDLDDLVYRVRFYTA